jgi:LacI family transcriptional regulator, galactose operon repressor
MKRVTINDVAAEAGVSRATVSLVLRENPRVAESTRQKVRDVMADLGYVYDRRAADMRTRRGMTIGLVLTDVRNPYFAELSMAFEVTLNDHGYVVLQGYTQDERARQDRVLDVMLEHRVDGIILLPAKDTSAEDLRRRAGLTATPHVLVARRVGDYEADYVGADNVRAGALLGEHFGSEGYEDVAFLGGPIGSTSRAERLRGVRLGLKRHGVRLERNRSIGTANDRQGGVTGVEQLLAQGPPPDAIACYSDVIAFGVESGLRAAGIVPGADVAVGSFDDIPEAALQHPPLTSVATHPERVGAEAARLLLERIDAPDVAPRRVLLSPRLSVRASSTTRLARTGSGSEAPSRRRTA